MDKGKKGGVLVLTLLVMFVGTIILGGLFMYLDTSMLLATKGEENAVSYYASDSGVEDAILWLQHEPWLPHEEPLAGWNVSCDPRNPADQPCLNSYTLGNRTVDVSVINPQSEGFGNNTFKITSTATADSGARTEITSYIQMASLDFYRYGEDVITTNCSATIRGQKSSVVGNVTYVCWVDCGADPSETDLCPVEGEDCCKETVTGNVSQDNTLPPGIDWWPETWAIAQYFKDQVDISKPFSGGTIDVAVNSTIGPLYVDGNLDIYTSVDGASASLAGVVYVTGDLTMTGTAISTFTINLSDQVIFVENEGADIGGGPNTASAEVLIDSDCTLTGSGVHLQPLGDFYGSIAGQLEVDLWPNLYIERTDGTDLWNTLPDIDVNLMKIITYDIIDQ
jgi:hypothetical protein